MEWFRIIAKSSTSSVAQSIDFSTAAQTDGAFTRVAPYLQPHSALSRPLHHNELAVLLLKLRGGAGPIRAHTGTFEDDGPLGLADRLCLRCDMGVVDTLPHAFLHCTHFTTVHEIGGQSLASSGSVEQWDKLTEVQQLALLLLETAPATFGLEGESLQNVIGAWTTGTLQLLRNDTEHQ